MNLEGLIHDFIGNALKCAIKYGTIAVWLVMFIKQGVKVWLNIKY